MTNTNIPAFVSDISSIAANNFIAMGGTTFAAAVPMSVQPLYRRANYMKQWTSTGYVPTWHQSAKGIIQTNIGVSLCDTLSKVLSGNLLVVKNDPLERWIQDSEFTKVVNGAIDDAVRQGTSLIKLNRNFNGTYAENYAMDRFIATADSQGNVLKAKIFIEYIECGQLSGNRNGYWLVEERQRVGGAWVSTYSLCRGRLEKSLSGEVASKIDYLYEPTEEVKEWLEWKGVVLGEQVAADFGGTSGLFLLKVRNLAYDKNSAYGESLATTVVNDFIEYEYNSSLKLLDQYTGKSRIMVGDEYANGGYGVGGLDNFMYLKVPTATVEGIKPEALQFEYRTDDHIKTKEEILESIAAKIGISAITIGSFLRNSGGNRTATEINAESDLTTNFAVAIRRDFIMPLVKRVLKAAGFEDLNIAFPVAGFTSQVLRIEQAIKLYTSGLATIEQALNYIYPDFTDEQIGKMAENIKAEKPQMDDLVI